jgi:hypothetical protein
LAIKVIFIPGWLINFYKVVFMLKKYILDKWIIILVFSVLLASCGGGGGGSPASPPIISGVAGDGQIQINFTALNGVYYWLWYTQSSQPFDINNPPNVPQQGFTTLLPPYTIGNLTDGLPSSVVVNAHAGNPNGPGGPQSNNLILTPRLAGYSWSSCTTNCPNQVMNAVTFGDALVATSNTSLIHVYVGVGNNASIFTSADGLNWTPQPTSATQACNLGNNTLYGADYNNGTFNVVGANGTICFNSQSVGNNLYNGLTDVLDSNGNWAPQNAIWSPATTKPTSVNNQTLYAVAADQQLYNSLQTNNVIVGSNGTLLYSADGANWYGVTSGTTQNLYALNFVGNCGLLTYGYQWIVVGANGTILRSTDASGATSWTQSSVNIPTQNNLRGVACSPNTSPYYIQSGAVFPPVGYTPLVVAVGDNGTILTSSDGTTWTKQTSAAVGTDNLTSVYAFNRNLELRNNNTQFVATGASGNVYTSIDGVNWTANSTGASTLNAVTTAQGTSIPNGDFGYVPYIYVAVGASGQGVNATGFAVTSQ